MKFKKKRKKYISLKEAASLSGYASDYLGYLIRQGKIPGKKIYSHPTWVTTREAIKKYRAEKESEKGQKGIPIRNISSSKKAKRTNRKVSGISNKRRKILAFSWRAGLAIFLITCLITGFAPIRFIHDSIRALSKETKVVNFYSQNCSGDWQNSRNAQGEPEVGPGEDIDSFSEENSAVYISGSSFLVCQDFVREEEIVELEVEPEPLEPLPVEEGTSTNKEIEEGTSTDEGITIGDEEDSTTTEATTEIINEPQEGTSSQSEDSSSTEMENVNNEEEPISFFGKIKKSFAFAQEDEQFKSAKIKLSFAIGEKDSSEVLPEVLPIEQATTTQLQPTSSDLDINTSSEEIISFWDRIKGFFKSSVVRAEETEEGSEEENTEEDIEEEPPASEEIPEPEAPAETPIDETIDETETTTEVIIPETLPVEATSTEEIVIPGTTTEATATEEIIEEEATSTEIEDVSTTSPEDVLETAIEPLLLDLDTKIIIWYSLDGEVWWELGSVFGYPLSNSLNGGYFEYNAPFLRSFEDVNNLRIKFEGTIDGETNIASFLDSAWIEVTYDQQKRLNKEEIENQDKLKIDLLSSKKVFKGDEDPQFRFQYKKEKSVLASIVGMVNPSNSWQDINVTAEVKNYQGLKSAFSPELILGSNGDFFVNLRKSPRKLRPGRYKLIIRIEDSSSGSLQVVEIEESFIWGVLAINTNKSIYLPNEWAYLQMAALRDSGDTICNANLALTIITPGGKTVNLVPEKSGQCKGNNVTDVPDYSVYYQVDRRGTYQMKLTNLDNGYEISDSFEVKSSVPFDIERFGPTRIFPSAAYQMMIRVKANQDFRGRVVETVPLGFEITGTEITGQEARNGEKSITWNADWQKGKTYELSYEFDAPDISPYLYFLGPFQIGSFKEIRQWQIASDQLENMILLWDKDEAPPTGWTCISCSPGDDFYQVFPRGEQTYGAATSGADTHSHTVSTSSCTTAAGPLNQDKTGLAISADGHTHTGIDSQTVIAASNNPLYRNLKFIKCSGVTTTIPNGAIAIFDTVSLPSGDWDLYTDQDGYFLRGENSTTTGGSNTHTHSVSITSSVPNTTDTTQTAAGNYDLSNHKHTGSNTSNEVDHQPPYLEVVFAKANNTTTMSYNGLIAMFDDEPDSDWNIVSTSTGDFYQKFIVASSTAYGGTGGKATNTHTNLDIALGATANTGSNADIQPASVGASYGHTHTMTVQFTTENNLPVYRDVIFAKFAGGNSAPSVSNINLNSGSVISLVESSATTVQATATISDGDTFGDITSIIGRVFRSQVTSTENCTTDANNCTATTSCATTTPCSGNDCTALCTFNIWFIAEPTDIGSDWATDTWDAWMEVTDSAGATSSATNTTQGIEINTLAALDVTDEINYGLLEIEGSNSPLNQTTTATTTGNVAIDANISGTFMCTDYPTCNVSTSIAYQQYATASGVAYDAAAAWTATSGTPILLEFESSKPTATPSSETQKIYWGTYVPSSTAIGSYTGVNTFSAQADP